MGCAFRSSGEKKGRRPCRPWGDRLAFDLYYQPGDHLLHTFDGGRDLDRTIESREVYRAPMQRHDLAADHDRDPATLEQAVLGHPSLQSPCEFTICIYSTSGVSAGVRVCQSTDGRKPDPEVAFLDPAGIPFIVPIGVTDHYLSLRRGAEAVNERLSNVTDWQAEIFVLRHVENLPIGKIAQRMSRSNDAVRSSLCRVKRLLVEAVDPERVRAAKSVAEGGVA